MASPKSVVQREKFGLLRELDLFGGVSDADIEAIGHSLAMTHCQSGRTILSPDDPPDRVHILKSGRVRVYRVSPDGKQLTLDIFEKGTILGDMTLLGQPRIPEAYAESLGDTVICTLTPTDLRQLIELYPQIGANIIGHLSRRLMEAERELEAMAFQRVGQRLAHKLLDLAGRFGVASDGTDTVITERLTQQQLADMIGTTRETLAHTLGDFRRRGLVDMAGQSVVIRDAPRLTEIANGDHT